MEYRIMPPGIILPDKALQDYEEYHKGSLESQMIQKALRQIRYKRDSGKISSETIEDSAYFQIDPLETGKVYTLHLKQNREPIARIRVEDKSDEFVKLLIINLTWEWEATPFIYNLLLDLQIHFDAKYVLDNETKAELLSIAQGDVKQIVPANIIQEGSEASEYRLEQATTTEAAPSASVQVSEKRKKDRRRRILAGLVRWRADRIGKTVDEVCAITNILPASTYYTYRGEGLVYTDTDIVGFNVTWDELWGAHTRGGGSLDAYITEILE